MSPSSMPTSPSTQPIPSRQPSPSSGGGCSKTTCETSCFVPTPVPTDDPTPTPDPTPIPTQAPEPPTYILFEVFLPGASAAPSCCDIDDITTFPDAWFLCDSDSGANRRPDITSDGVTFFVWSRLDDSTGFGSITEQDADQSQANLEAVDPAVTVDREEGDLSLVNGSGAATLVVSALLLFASLLLLA